MAPFSAVFNNLIRFNQHEKQNRPEFIEPELAESWTWNEDYTRLTFKLRDGVKWHDGKPFTAADVKCTWDLLLGKSKDKLRLNPRKAWYRNLDDVVTEGDDAVTFVLKRPQPAFHDAARLRPMAPVYPCHVPAGRDAARSRSAPARSNSSNSSRNEYIKFAKNPDYWKKGLPYLDAIEWTIIPNRSTQTLAFIAGQFDMTFPYEADRADDEGHAEPGAERDLRTRPDDGRRSTSWSIATSRRSTIPDIRMAMMLAIDRKAFLDIIIGGPRADRRRDADAAAGAVGPAAGDPANPAGLRAGRRSEPRRGAQADGKARLRAEQPARGQGRDAQHRAIPRPGRHPDRPDEADLYRRRTRSRRDRELVSEDRPQGLTRSPAI